MPTNNLGQSDIVTHQTNIWNKSIFTVKRLFTTLCILDVYAASMK
jgi:hypothetical protein